MTKPGDAIEISGLNKWYGDYQALKGIDLNVAHGERIVVCGPSGSGKSTLIRCVNSLEEHDSGRIVVDGIEMIDNDSINAIRSEVGMVFQQFNLFPHLSILQNLTLGPMKARGMSKADADARAMEYLERVRNNSALPLHARSVWSRKSCFLTNPHRPLIQR
jgi:general L-amino acid transport system ATP-binding protein